MSMKKFIILLLSILILINSSGLIAFAAFTDSLETDAEIAYLVSADDENGIIYDKNSQLRCDPGALVKIVTAILVIENCEDLSQSVTASGSAIRSIEHLGVTTAGILVGETITVEELLYCLLVYNANDAANVLAEFIAGTNEKFVEKMNEFAKAQGLSVIVSKIPCFRKLLLHFYIQCLLQTSTTKQDILKTPIILLIRVFRIIM